MGSGHETSVYVTMYMFIVTFDLQWAKKYPFLFGGSLEEVGHASRDSLRM